MICDIQKREEELEVFVIAPSKVSEINYGIGLL
jgi:hypothetical protein